MKRLLTATILAAALAAPAYAQALRPLDSDSEPDRIDWSALDAKFGPLPTPKAGTKIGAVAKTLINEYWRSLGHGFSLEGAKYQVPVSLQAAQNEGDQLGQLSIAENMLEQHFSVLLVSPQTDANLQPAVEQAKTDGVPVINVNDAVIPTAEHYVGNVQRDNGVRAANWFIANRTQGGKVAVIEGMAGVYAARERTAGFRDTIAKSGKLQVVASVPGNWDRQMSYDDATTLLQQHPDLVGFYCNNDGVVEAVKAAGKLGQVAVIGTDGISDAYKSIAAGELTATVDSFPVLTGAVSVDVALRLLAGEKLPRVVATPQALITKANMARYSGSPEQVRAALVEDAKQGG